MSKELMIPTKQDFQQMEAKIDQILSILDREKHESVETDWIKSKEAKALLQCSDSTLKNYRDKGLIPWKKVGGTYYYKPKLNYNEQYK